MLTLLDRSTSYHTFPSHLNEKQIQMDDMLNAFTHEAANWKSLLAMSLGTFAFRFGNKIFLKSCHSLKSSMFSCLSRGSAFAGLASEVTVYRISNKILDKDFHAIFSKNWMSDFVNFGTLKLFGKFLPTHNILLRHLFQDVSLLAANNFSSLILYGFQNQDSFVDQLMKTELLNFQMQAGAELLNLSSRSVFERGRYEVLIQKTIPRKNYFASIHISHPVFMAAQHLRSAWSAYRSQMRQVAHEFPIPDMETEAALFEKLQASNFQDRHLMTRFVNPHLPGICAMASNFYGHPDLKMELIHIGNAAMLEAVRRFDLGKKTPFSNYASRSARGAMLNFILENSGIRLTTRAQRDAFWNMSQVARELTDRGLEASSENLAEQFNERMALRKLKKDKKEETYENIQDALSRQRKKITAEDISKIRKLRQHCLVKSMSEPNKEGEDDRTLLESLESPDKSAHHLYEETDLQIRIRKKIPEFIKALDARGKVIFRRMILRPMEKDDPQEKDTLKMLGRKFGISHERVRQLKERIQEKFRVFFEEENPFAF